MKEKIAYNYLIKFRIRKIKTSFKKKFSIKGDLRDFLNPYLLLKSTNIIRFNKVPLNIKKFEKIFNMVFKDINNENAILLASPIWESSLKEKLLTISSLFLEKKFIELQNIYEELFVCDLMEGAVSHQESISLISKLSQATRFFSRSRKLIKIKEKFNKELILLLQSIILSKNYNYGRPFAYKNDSLINIECLDEQFFALKIAELIKNNVYDEIVFVGDGAGFLTPIIIGMYNFYHKQNNCKYRIVDFLYFATSTYLRIEKCDNPLIINLPETLHNYSGNNIEPKFLPKIQGRRLIVNQDSFPEMKKESIISYTQNKATITDIASYNQLPQKSDKKHTDYLSILKKLNYKELCNEKSPIRDNYFVSFHTNRSL